MMRTSGAVRSRGRVVATLVASASVVGLSAVPSSATSPVTGPVLVARAVGLTVTGSGVFHSATLPGVGDTGPIITQKSGDHGPECGVGAPSTLLASVTAACGGAVTQAPGAASAVAWVGDVTVAIPGAGDISLIGVRSTSGTTCSEGPKASSQIEQVTVSGMPVSIAPGPNTQVLLVDRAGLRVTLIADERLTGGPGVGVNAARLIVKLTGGNDADIKIASSSSGALNCPTA